MKVVVISDTHIKTPEKKLPDRLIVELKTADLIIHAGDWKIPEVYHELVQYGPVEGVHGNIDGEDIKSLVPEKRILDINEWSLGIVHGHGEGKTTEKRVLDAFDQGLDIIIFGHSHLPLLRHHKKTILFNPGSPTDKRGLPYYSFGVLHVEKELKAEHIYFSHK